MTQVSDPALEAAVSTSSDGLDLTQVPADIPGFRANVAFRIAVEDAARQAQLPVSSWIYKTIGDAIGQQVEVKTSRAKMTEAERKAKDDAAKEAAKAERARAKELLQASRHKAAESATNGAVATAEPEPEATV